MADDLKKYADAVYKCIRCGACRAVCPTFGEELSETAVARGRMALVEAVINGGLDLTPAFEKAVFNCAMCGACKANCPSGVDVPGIIEAARLKPTIFAASSGTAEAVPYPRTDFCNQVLGT